MIMTRAGGEGDVIGDQPGGVNRGDVIRGRPGAGTGQNVTGDQRATIPWKVSVSTEKGLVAETFTSRATINGG